MGDTSVLHINQAIMIPSIMSILLCPMQCCLHGISVNDIPKFLMKNPIVNNHAVIVPSDINDSPLNIPLMPQGVSYFPVQATFLSEYKSDVILKFHLTAEALAWDPGLSSYSLQAKMVCSILGDKLSAMSQQQGDRSQCRWTLCVDHHLHPIVLLMPLMMLTLAPTWNHIYAFSWLL